jgi:transketolase
MEANYRAEITNSRSWNLQTSGQLARSAVAGMVLADMADDNPDIMVLTADLKYSNGTVEFERRHPTRFLNVGIAEQFMVSAAAGLSTMGFIPYVATFASFVGLLALEQIRTDLAYPNLKVRILAHHAGIAMGYYGTSHHALEDIAALRALPNLTILAPCDALSLEAVLRGEDVVRVSYRWHGPVHAAELVAWVAAGPGAQRELLAGLEDRSGRSIH